MRLSEAVMPPTKLHGMVSRFTEQRPMLLHCETLEPRMPVEGQKHRFRPAKRRSAVPRIAAIKLSPETAAECQADVSRCSSTSVQRPDLLDQLIGGDEQAGRHGQAERLRRLEVDDHFE